MERRSVRAGYQEVLGVSDTTQVLEPGDSDADRGSKRGGVHVLGLVFGAAGLALALLALVGVLYVGARVGDVDDDIDEMEHMHGEWMGQMGPGQMGPGQMGRGQMDPGHMGPGGGNGRGGMPGMGGPMPGDELMNRFDREDFGELSEEDRATLRERLDEARERLDELEQQLDEADTDAPDQTVATTTVSAG
jgi:hypothetical protein